MEKETWLISTIDGRNVSVDRETRDAMLYEEPNVNEYHHYYDLISGGEFFIKPEHIVGFFETSSEIRAAYTRERTRTNIEYHDIAEELHQERQKQIDWDDAEEKSKELKEDNRTTLDASIN